MALDYSRLSENERKAEYEKEMALYEQYKQETGASDEESGFFSKVLDVAQPAFNVLDIPESIVRTGVEAAISPQREVIPEVSKQIGNIIESPLYGAAKAPTGADILGAAMPESYNPESLGGKVAGVVTEMAVGALPNPFGLAARIPKIKKIVRAPFYSASERQAAKTVARYATKAKVSGEGVDPDTIGRFLVAQDLQGEMRNPSAFYKKIAGTHKVDKEIPDTLETLVINKGKKESGLIGQTSEELEKFLKNVETEYNITSIQPAQAGFQVILDNIKKKISQTSGETPDLERIQDVINRSLKPFKKEEVFKGKTQVIKTAGGDLEFQDVPELISKPVTITLTELHELRKNIGKLLSDRDFYKTPDMAMSMETETLRDVYRQLGETIENTLDGLKIKKGADVELDAKELYKAQNNKLKHLYDLKSMLEYTPIKELKESDLAAIVAGGVAKGAALGTAGLVGAISGFPQYSIPAAATGATLGLGLSAAQKVEQATPEYLTSILKQASNVAPEITGTAGAGAGMLFKGNAGREPQSIGIDPMQIAKSKLPRTTEGLIQKKELVVAKLAQANIPPEMIKAFVQALNEDPEAVSGIATQLTTMAPHLFEKAKYNTFDGIISDPDEAARAADQTSKRDDLDSIQKAKLINELNKNQRWLGE